MVELGTTSTHTVPLALQVIRLFYDAISHDQKMTRIFYCSVTRRQLDRKKCHSVSLDVSSVKDVTLYLLWTYRVSPSAEDLLCTHNVRDRFL